MAGEIESINYEELERRLSLSEEETRAEVDTRIKQARTDQRAHLDIAEYRIDRLPALPVDLRSLDCSDTEISDLTPLAGLTGLQTLNCGSTQVGDLSQLAGMSGLKVLNCEGTQVNDLSPLAGLAGLQELYCAGAQVRDLSPLAGLAGLQEFYCAGTQVSDLSPLAELAGLQTLHCSSTQVNDLSPLAGLADLQGLYCAGTQVSDLSPLAGLAGLQALNCSATRVSDLSPLAGLAGLQELYCAGTQVSDLSPLVGLAGLQTLNCSATRVSDLSPLVGLAGLQTLDCGSTRVSDLAPLTGLLGLKVLRCNGAQVSDLSPLGGLAGLQEFYCMGTQVSDLSPLAGLAGLQEFFCNSAQVSDLSPLSGLSGLQTLGCSDTQVSDLSPLAGLAGLQELYCAGTQVSDLSPLAGLVGLQILNCVGTRVSDLSPLAELANLQAFDCESAQVNDLAPLAGLSALEELDCSNNVIGRWPEELAQLPKLRLIAVGARIGSVPPEDLSQSYDDDCLPRLRSYFDDLRAGAEPLERVKLIVLGNGRVGKTQLRRWLLNSPENPTPFDPSIPSTHGIEVLRGAVSIPDPAGGRAASLDASIWDFGGQDIYHGTHGLFMKTRAIFLLCWSPGEESRREQELGGLVHQNQPMAYWVDYVRQLAGTDNPVIVVQTQCDGAADEQAHRHAGVDRLGFDSFKSLSFSASTNRGGAALREAIGEAANWLKQRHGTPLIGKGRLDVLNRLEGWRSEDAVRPPEARAHKLLTQEEFAALCAEAGGIADPQHLLNFLHHAGVVFHRQGVFGDRIVLDQDWALAAIYSAFDRTKCYPLLKAMNGRFTADLLGRLAWQTYSEDEQRVFLGMMESCGIAFVHHRGREHADTEYIAPDLLPDRPVLAETIESRWHGPDIPVTATLRFPLLHQGLIRQVLAKVGDQARLNADYWRTGVLFYERERQATALIEAVADETGWGGEIRIACRSGRAQEVLTLLVKEIRETAERTGLSPDSVEGDVSEPPREKPVEPAAPIEIAAPPRLGPRWYVSYAWGDATPEGKARDAQVDDLCQRAAEQGITILRDRDQVRNNDSIRRFMAELAGGDRIIVILSAKYLKSPYCMFELYQAWRKQQADDDLFAGVIRAFRLDDAAIGEMQGRAAVGRYWAEKVERDRECLDYAGARDAVDWQLARHYALDVADILYAINDRVSPLDWDAFCDWAFET